MFHLWWSFWWLVFPLAFFLFAAWDRWLGYRRSRHALDLMKSYVAQGKDPPPELMRDVRQDAEGEDADWRGPWRYRYRRAWRYGRYWQWRGAIITAAVAIGFWVAAENDYVAGAGGVFRFIALILTCVAGARLAVAVISSTFRDR